MTNRTLGVWPWYFGNPEITTLSRAHYRCDIFDSLSILTFVGTTVFAQMALTLRSVISGCVLTVAKQNRIYAITGKNHKITVCFGVITTSQLALGSYLAAMIIAQGGESLAHRVEVVICTYFDASGQRFQPEIPLDAYVVCSFPTYKLMEIGYTAISLVYGAKSSIWRENQMLTIPQTF